VTSATAASPGLTQRTAVRGDLCRVVTAFFRVAYAEGDAQHRERWSLDWPEMRVESIGN
jgi:hypothetical protein